MALFRQIAIQPVPPGSRFIDKDQVWGFGLQRAAELIKVALPRANGPKVNALGVVVVGNRGDGDRRFRHIQCGAKSARRAQGGPPSSCACSGMLWRWLWGS